MVCKQRHINQERSSVSGFTLQESQPSPAGLPLQESQPRSAGFEPESCTFSNEGPAPPLSYGPMDPMLSCCGRYLSSRSHRKQRHLKPGGQRIHTCPAVLGGPHLIPAGPVSHPKGGTSSQVGTCRTALIVSKALKAWRSKHAPLPAV